MKIVTLQDVKERINNIVNEQWDDESAHCLEAGLYEDVLYTIAQNMITKEEMSLLAAEAIRTKAIDFSRWFA